MNLQDLAARDLLAKSNLKIGSITTRPANAGAGVVIEQKPPSGATVAPGSAVDLVIASAGGGGATPGAPRVVPDVVKLPLPQAVELLQRAGFKVGKINRKRSDRPADTVTKQEPDAGKRAKPGTEVELDVAVREIKTVSVPDVVGDDRARAIRKMEEKGLRVGEIKEQAGCEAGKVVAQTPPEDARVPTDTAVAITVAVPGEGAATMPRLIGLQQNQAEGAVRQSRLTLRKIDRRETDQQSPGTVIDQKPDPHTTLARGCPVEIVVAAPIPLIVVPSFVGLSEAEARRQLPGGVGGAFAELRLGRVTYRDVDSSSRTDTAVYRRGQVPTPTVVSQNPSANSRVRRGTEVDLVVARPRGDVRPQEDYRTVPSLNGMDRAQAETAIRRAGLSVGQVSFAVSRAKTGTVIKQSPEPGTQVRAGTPVSLVIASPYIG
jgi:beta-lactam-binding protein with PASTA domain